MQNKIIHIWKYDEKRMERKRKYMGIITVLVVVFLILCVICAFKESKVTGTYKAFGVYGRVKAYLALDFIFAGLAMAVMGIVSLVSGEIGAAGALGSMAFGLVLAVLGVWIYYSTWHKCSEVLKSRCIISMLNRFRRFVKSFDLLPWFRVETGRSDGSYG